MRQPAGAAHVLGRGAHARASRDRSAHCARHGAGAEHAVRAGTGQRAGAPHVRLRKDDVLGGVHHRARSRCGGRERRLLHRTVRRAEEGRQACRRSGEEGSAHHDSRGADADGAVPRFAGMHHPAAGEGRRVLRAGRGEAQAARREDDAMADGRQAARGSAASRYRSGEADAGDRCRVRTIRSHSPPPSS